MNDKERARQFREIARLFSIPPMHLNYTTLYKIGKRTVIFNHEIEYKCNYYYTCNDSNLIMLN